MSTALKSLEQRFAITDLQDWAASTFDPNMIYALQISVNKKSFTKLTRDDTRAFFE